MIACPSCGAPNGVGALACARCGTAMGDRSPPEPSQTRQRHGLTPRTAPAVPQRSIPTRIGPVPPRAPPPAVGADSAPGPWPPLPMQPGCRSCGRPVQVARRFCSCGATLSTPEPRSPEPAPRAPSMVGEWSRHRTFRRSMMAADRGAKPRFDRPTSPRVLLTRFATILLLVLAVGAQLDPWGSELRRLVAERVEGVLVGTSTTR